MSVKRYQLTRGTGNDGADSMEISEQGPHVLYSDYADLEKRCEDAEHNYKSADAQASMMSKQYGEVLALLASAETRLAAAEKVVGEIRGIVRDGEVHMDQDWAIMEIRSILRATEAKASCEHGCVDGEILGDPRWPMDTNKQPCPSCNPKEAKP